MGQFVVSFTVQPGHRDDFVKIAQKTGRDSLANEPGSLRFEAFDAHASGPYFGAFFAEAGTYGTGPTWLMKANVLEPAA
jgi:quinol monooxygenase YgiN